MANKLQFSPKLYLGKSMDADKLDKIKRTLVKKPILSGVYIVVPSRNPSDQLEIYSAKQLCQSYYKKNPPYIFGIASDYDEALSIVEQIVQECLDTRGDCRLKEFCYGRHTD